MQDPKELESDSDSQGDHSYRRTVLKTMGVGMAAGLAGCSGGGGDGGGSTPTPKVKTVVKTVTPEGGAPDLSGRTVKITDTTFLQAGRQSIKAFNQVVGAFEAATGATVVTQTTDSKSQIVQNWRAGKQPHLFIAEPNGMGTMIDAGWIKPTEEYADEFPELTDGLLPHIERANEHVFQGWGKKYALPITVTPKGLFLGRLDHYEQTPGLSRKDFPPKDMDELIDHGKTFIKEGTSEFGYQPNGDASDFNDVEFIAWTMSLMGQEGTRFGNDWSAPNWTKQKYSERIHQKINLFRKHGLGSPNTPNLESETAMTLVNQGRASFYSASCSEPYLALRGRAPDKVFGDNPDIQFAKGLPGSKNVHCDPQYSSFALPKKPEGKTQKKWEKNQAAAKEFIKYMLDTNILDKTLPQVMGVLPVTQKKWDAVPMNKRTTAANWAPAMKAAVEDSDKKAMATTGAHPLQTFALDYMPKRLSKARVWQDSPKKPIDKVLEDATQTVKDRIPSGKFD